MSDQPLLIVVRSNSIYAPRSDVDSALSVRESARKHGNAYMVPANADFLSIQNELGRCSIVFQDEEVASGKDSPRLRAVEAGHHLVGSHAVAAQRASDKWQVNCILRDAGVAVPSARPVPEGREILQAVFFDMISYPAVLKPRFGGGSRSVHLVDTAEQAKVALREDQYRNDSDFIAEHFLDGTEFTVWLIETSSGLNVSALAISKPQRILDSYTKSKLQFSARPVRPVPPTIVSSAERAWSVLGLSGYARFDVIDTQNGPAIIDVNPTPRLNTGPLGPDKAVCGDFDDILQDLLKNTFETASRQS